MPGKSIPMATTCDRQKASRVDTPLTVQYRRLTELCLCEVNITQFRKHLQLYGHWNASLISHASNDILGNSSTSIINWPSGKQVAAVAGVTT